MNGGGSRHAQVGLCVSCAHHREVGNRKGSIFHMCERAKSDPRYAKYPPLPVTRCAGYAVGPVDPWATFADEP